MITQMRLVELLNYKEDTGVFTWNSSPSNNVKQNSIAGTIVAGYRYIRIDTKRYSAHRLAWLYVHGGLPAMEIDHINHIRDDNRICNLRDVSRLVNGKNVSQSPLNTSGITGVDYFKNTKKWRARIKVKGREIALGYYSNILDAVAVRRNAELKYNFHRNHGG